jgi:hypothetical protein
MRNQGVEFRPELVQKQGLPTQAGRRSRRGRGASGSIRDQMLRIRFS